MNYTKVIESRTVVRRTDGRVDPILSTMFPLDSVAPPAAGYYVTCRYRVDQAIAPATHEISKKAGRDPDRDNRPSEAYATWYCETAAAAQQLSSQLNELMETGLVLGVQTGSRNAA